MFKYFGVNKKIKVDKYVEPKLYMYIKENYNPYSYWDNVIVVSSIREMPTTIIRNGFKYNIYEQGY